MGEGVRSHCLQSPQQAPLKLELERMVVRSVLVVGQSNLCVAKIRFAAKQEVMNGAEKVLRSAEEVDCRSRVDAASAEELLTASLRLPGCWEQRVWGILSSSRIADSQGAMHTLPSIAIVATLLSAKSTDGGAHRDAGWRSPLPLVTAWAQSGAG